MTTKQYKPDNTTKSEPISIKTVTPFDLNADMHTLNLVAYCLYLVYRTTAHHISQDYIFEIINYPFISVCTAKCHPWHGQGFKMRKPLTNTFKTKKLAHLSLEDIMLHNYDDAH